jgi:hypothetical protein
VEPTANFAIKSHAQNTTQGLMRMLHADHIRGKELGDALFVKIALTLVTSGTNTRRHTVKISDCEKSEKQMFQSTGGQSAS